MNYKNRLIHHYWPIVLIISLCTCANIQSPAGGPEDKTPPEIIEIRPLANSTGVPLAAVVEILFSKNMNKTSTEKAIFISPLFFDYPEFKWSGKKLKITLPEKLQPQTTYVLTIGALAVDNRGNKLGQSVSFPFSTGQIIHAGSIYGQVLVTKTGSLNIWAYKLDSNRPDTFWMKLPDYITQPDSLGEFKFEYLSYGKYLVAAVEDKNNDQFWMPPSEKLALPDTLIELSENRIEYGPIVMMTVDRDTLQPGITRIISPDDHTIRVEFSHRMDTANVFSVDNYRIHSLGDSMSLLSIDEIFPVAKEVKAVYLKCSQLNTGEKYKLNAAGFKSIYGMVADTLSRVFEAGGADTTAPELLRITPKSSSPQPVGFDITIWFSEAMDTSELARYITVSDTFDTPISFQVIWNYPNKLAITPEFQAGDKYLISFDEQNIFDLAGNPLGDTIVSYKFYTAPEDTFGQATGRVVNAPGLDIIVVAEADGVEQVTTKCDNKGLFMFDRLFPAVYRLKAIHDKNKNGLFDGGKIRPFEFAEQIVLYGDTVVVRTRWETDVGVLDFKPSEN